MFVCVSLCENRCQLFQHCFLPVLIQCLVIRPMLWLIAACFTMVFTMRCTFTERDTSPSSVVSFFRWIQVCVYVCDNAPDWNYIPVLQRTNSWKLPQNAHISIQRCPISHCSISQHETLLPKIPTAKSCFLLLPIHMKFNSTVMFVCCCYLSYFVFFFVLTFTIGHVLTCYNIYHAILLIFFSSLAIGWDEFVCDR